MTCRADGCSVESGVAQAPTRMISNSIFGREKAAGCILLVLAVGDPGTTAHVHGLAGHEVRLVGGYEDDRPGDLLGATEALERHVARGLGDHGRRLPHLEHAFR